MNFILSNIADIHFAEVDGQYAYQSNYATVRKALEHRLGLELVDLSLSGSLDQNREAFISAIHRNVALLDGLPLCIHAPFSELYPHAMESQIRKVAHDSLSQAYSIAEEMGAQTMVVHANHVATIYHPEWFISHQISFWKEFLNEHSGRCVVAIENTIDETPDQLLRIAQGVDDPRFGICLDMGHAHLSPTPVEQWVRTMASKIRCYHIHNNDGIRKGILWFESDTHNAVHDGTLDMAQMLRLAGELTPQASVTIETSVLDASISWLKEKQFI